MKYFINIKHKYWGNKTLINSNFMIPKEFQSLTGNLLTLYLKWCHFLLNLRMLLELLTKPLVLLMKSLSCSSFSTNLWTTLKTLETLCWITSESEESPELVVADFINTKHMKKEKIKNFKIWDPNIKILWTKKLTIRSPRLVNFILLPLLRGHFGTRGRGWPKA